MLTVIRSVMSTAGSRRPLTNIPLSDPLSIAIQRRPWSYRSTRCAQEIRGGHPDVGAQVTADHDVVPCCEGALRPVAANGENRRDWSAHRNQLYRYCRRRPLISLGRRSRRTGSASRSSACALCCSACTTTSPNAHRRRLDPVEQIRLGQQGPAHRHELESVGHRPVHGLAVGDPAQQDQRQGELLSEPHGVARAQ